MMNKLQQLKMLFKAVFGVSVTILAMCAVILHKQNKKLTESLETAKNNIEMYQNTIAGATEQNNTLRLTIDELNSVNDSLILTTMNKAKEFGIKTSNINTIATQNQSLYVKGGKGGYEDISSSVIQDSILFNDETLVCYTLYKDSIDITLDISNTQDLYVYKHKEYKNKKNFFKRLFTLDFKKVWKESYLISNSNDLISTSDVRVIEIIQ